MSQPGISLDRCWSGKTSGGGGAGYASDTGSYSPGSPDHKVRSHCSGALRRALRKGAAGSHTQAQSKRYRKIQGCSDADSCWRKYLKAPASMVDFEVLISGAGLKETMHRWPHHAVVHSAGPTASVCAGAPA